MFKLVEAIPHIDSAQIKNKSSDHEVSFVQALAEKYIDINKFILTNDDVLCSDITFIGFDAESSVVKQLTGLKFINLSRCGITRSGKIDALTGALDRVTLLDLSENDLDWNEIIKILSCLPRLQELILNANRLSEVPDTFPLYKFKKLQSLTIGKTKITWSSLLEIVSGIWEGITRIDLWNDKLQASSMTLDDRDKFQEFTNQVYHLALSENKFADIDWIENIGSTRYLRILDLSHCGIHNLSLSNNAIVQLSELAHLVVSFNDIVDWKYISQLNRLPKLASLICNDNPFYITEKQAEAMVVARIMNLKYLNRVEIQKNMRRDSEILYWKRTFDEYKLFKLNKNDDFHVAHPRYLELIGIYGLPDEKSENETTNKYVSVELCCYDKKVNKKLPSELRVANLKMISKRLFKLKATSKVELLCLADDTTCYPLDKDSQTLQFFSIKDGCRLLVQVSE